MRSPKASSHRRRVYGVLSDLLPVLTPGAELVVDRDEIILRAGASRARVATETLLSACQQQPEHRWPEVIETWLQAVTQQISDTAAPVSVDPSRLRVQAVPRLGEPPAGVSAGFNSAFDLLVVEDLGGSLRRLMQADLDGLQMSADQAVTTGLDATISEVLVRLDIRPHDLPGGGRIRMGSADGVPFVSAGIATVRQLAGVDSAYGTLVAVPRHSMIVVQPVTSRAELDTLPALSSLVGSMYDEGTDRCARDVYWFVAGDAYPVIVTSGADGRPLVRLPAEVQAVVATLPG